MQTVRDGDGNTYLLVKRSDESSLVRDPISGEERYVENAELTVVDGEPPLETASLAVPAVVRRVIRAVHDDRSLGLLVELVDAGPVSVTELMDASGACESELHGRLTEFRATGLVEEVDVVGQRGYEATEDAQKAVRLLRETEPADGVLGGADAEYSSSDT